MRLSALALAATASLSPAFAEEVPNTQFSSGNWSGAAYTDDAGGFSHCSVSVGYEGGATVWMGLYGNDSLSVLLSHPDVRFRPGETFESWLMLETGYPTRGISEAWDEGFAGMTLEGVDPSIEFLSQGVWLRLLGIGIDEAFDVNGIAEALVLAKDCLVKNSGSNPFASRAPGKVPPPPSVPDLKPRTGSAGGGGLGTRPGGALGTPAPKPAP